MNESLGPSARLSPMAEGARHEVRVLVAVNEDPWAHRRTRQVVLTLQGLGWNVTVASPKSSGTTEETAAVLIGHRALSSLLGKAYGPIARNLTRALWTAITLLPLPVRSAGLSAVASQLLGLAALRRELRSAPALVIVEDVLLLPTVLRHRGNARVVFDAREFFPRQFEHSLVWRILVGAGLRRMLLRLLPECDAVTTVSPGLTAGYRDLCGVEALTVLNVPPRSSFSPGSNRRGADHEGPLRLVFHGLANPNRGLESLIELGGLLSDSATVSMYLTGPLRYRRRLAKLSRPHPNVSVRAPVAFDEIPAVLRNHDVGLVLIRDVTFNLRHALPSKFFEYLHAGLPAAVGPSPDMAAIVRHYDCGIVAGDFTPSTLAEAMRELDRERLAEMAANAHRAACDLVAEVEYQKFEALVVGLVGASGSES